jgi:hypothetical protein
VKPKRPATSELRRWRHEHKPKGPLPYRTLKDELREIHLTAAALDESLQHLIRWRREAPDPAALHRLYESNLALDINVLIHTLRAFAARGPRPYVKHLDGKRSIYQ